MDNDIQEALSSTLEAVSQGFENNNTRFDSLEKRIQQVDLSLENNASKKIDALYKDMMDYSKKLYEANQRIDKLGSDVDSLKIKMS